MRQLILIFAIVVISQAKPGYDYPQPPQIDVRSQFPQGSQINVGNNFGSAIGPIGNTFQGGIGAGNGLGSVGNTLVSFQNGIGAGNGLGSAGNSFGSFQNGISAGNSLGAVRNTLGSFQNSINAVGSGPIIHKHVYVHVAPEDPEEPFRNAPIPVAPKQIHHKILFIKAPSEAPKAPRIVGQQAGQQEEKTLVYVLVKKPEELGDIQIPQPAPIQPSKPEVYFIKYKTNKEGGASSGGSGASLTDDSITIESGLRNAQNLGPIGNTGGLNLGSSSLGANGLGSQGLNLSPLAGGLGSLSLGSQGLGSQGLSLGSLPAGSGLNSGAFIRQSAPQPVYGPAA
ncbi:unnamed protein product [Brassicogethes aeneus]|uniref:DUF243 domain-containing protein n=1 Tax=Brassicogethes aeneus TaxID=1431903 RepID=A0A9P0ARJ0_BRAAE|nr:unnamed protein product [Brassicogethes aeneus]